MIIDIRFKLNLKELKQFFTTYFITFRDFTPNKVIFINIKLTNQAFTYLLITVNIVEIVITALNTGLFAYSINAKL